MKLPAIDREIQEYLKNNLNLSPAAIALKKSPFAEVTPQELAQQLTGLQKAKDKLPTWFEAELVLFPPGLNLEQTSSEATANYKAGLFEGQIMLDCTAGFGIDVYGFCQKFNKVLGFEQNEELVHLQRFNLKQMQVENIEIALGDGIEFLKNSEQHFDLIYVDPSRRDSNATKVFTLSDCTPDASKHLPLLLEKAENVMIKTSPLLDISQGLNDLPQTAHIHIVAVENEVKELLWLLPKKDKQPLKLTATNLTKKGDQLVNVQDFGNALDETAPYGFPENYLYEPNAALLKSGLFNWTATHFGLTKLHPNSHLYTSEKPITNFPGRIFKILNVSAFHKKEIQKRWKNKRANITTRNFRWPVSEIRKRFKIADGGKEYLFFTTDHEENAVVIHTQKAKI